MSIALKILVGHTENNLRCKILSTENLYSKYYIVSFARCMFSHNGLPAVHAYHLLVIPSLYCLHRYSATICYVQHIIFHSLTLTQNGINLFSFSSSIGVEFVV